VTNLGDSVFGGCTALGSVTIGSGVTVIPEYAFYPCTSLTNATLGANVARIAHSAFWNCTSLTDITLPASLTLIESSAFLDCTSLSAIRIPEHATVQTFAFLNCTGLESVYIGKGVTLQNNVFTGCTGIRSVNVAGSESTPIRGRLMSAAPRGGLLGASGNPDATTLGDYTFYGCSELEDVTLGSTVEEIGGGVFAGCSKLRTVTVEAGNDNYKVENGMLLTKNGATLVSAFGTETSIAVPSGVVTVEKGAFAGYATLSNVTLSASVVTIGEAAFSNCTVLATATILSNVTSIAAKAFYGTALATVYVSKGDTSHIRGLVEGTGYSSPVTYIELGDEPVVTEDWPETPSSVEGQTAAAAFGITGELANAKADDLAMWAKAKGVDFGDRGTIIPNAFLLNCANTPAAVATATEEAEEAIEITAITFDASGNPVLTYPATYGNGEVVLQGSANIGASASWHDGRQSGDRFFKTILRLK
jgi:hypothetical protein